MDNKEAERKQAAALERKRQRRWVKNSLRSAGGYWLSVGAPFDSHGLASTYNNWYCRCTPCTEANTAKLQEYLHREGSNG